MDLIEVIRYGNGFTSTLEILSAFVDMDLRIIVFNKHFIAALYVDEISYFFIHIVLSNAVDQPMIWADTTSRIRLDPLFKFDLLALYDIRILADKKHPNTHS